jgi:hypothetical protein
MCAILPAIKRKDIYDRIEKGRIKQGAANF